ncbi:glycosyltransferase family 2 protein [Halobacteria archaeon AArc-m2/3/4]|uniref:Glycosyltransferase family 2 protein n=1 Tax=Natronoglomus mannanivorans TaxID=2979990 RepID=A0ABT2QKE0_9EURY|nr:glycosyltransferase family 2 protein [Halobacteria archaeon AArc-m2/3/4]
MYKDHTIAVVIPAYNEVDFVYDVIRAQPEFVDRIYVIDDRSTDDTWSEIQNAAEDDKALTVRNGTLYASSVHSTMQVADASTSTRVVPIRHRENRGAGGAIKTGYRHAHADNIDVTVTVDGDGQMDPALMRKLLDPIVDGRVDYTKGNRLVGYSRQSMPLVRFVGNNILTYLTRIASGYWAVTDPQNGYTAISHRALDAIDIDDMYEYYGYCNDLLVKLNVAEMRVGDVVMNPIYGEEKSTIRYKTYIPRVSKMLLSTFLQRLRIQYVEPAHPIGLGFLVGSIAVALGVIGGIQSTLEQKDRTSELGSGRLLSGITFVLGVLLWLVVLVFDRQSNSGNVVVINE